MAEWTVEESLVNAVITVDMMEGRLTVAEAGDLQAKRRRLRGWYSDSPTNPPPYFPTGQWLRCRKIRTRATLPRGDQGACFRMFWFVKKGRKYRSKMLFGRGLRF